MQNLEHKTITSGGVQPTGEEGVVEALVSVTGIKDNVGDIIVPGAYSKTLKDRKPKGAWSHEWNTPVSKVREIKELMPGDPGLPKTLSNGEPWPKEAGALYVKAEFNLNTSHGKDAYENVKFFGEDCEWSIGYRVPKGGATKDAKSGIRYIKDLNLYEFSPVLFGAASEARSLNATSIKSLQFELDSDDDEELDEKEEDGEFEYKDIEPSEKADDDLPSDEELIRLLATDPELKAMAEEDFEEKSEERSEPREIELNAVVIEQLKTLQDQINKVLEIALGVSEAKEIEPVEIPSKSLDEAINDILDSDADVDQKTLRNAMKLERTEDADERKTLAIDVLDRIDNALNDADANAEFLLKTLAKAIGDSYGAQSETSKNQDNEENDPGEKADNESEGEVKTLTLTEEEFKDLLGNISEQI